MKKLLALCLALALCLSLGGCSLKGLLQEYLPEQSAVESLLETAADDSPHYYESHPEIPDLGAMLGYTLYAKTPMDGFDYYYYEAKTGDLTGEFSSVRSDYASLCTELGYAPDYSVSGSLSLLIRFAQDAALLAAIETEDAEYICLIAADRSQLDAAMDSMTGTAAEQSAADWKQLYARYAVLLAAGINQIPDSSAGDVALAQSGEDALAQSLSFFESEDPRQAFREAGYAVNKVSLGSGYGTPYIEGTNANGITTRFALQYDTDTGTARLTVSENDTVTLSVFLSVTDSRCIKQVYDAQNQRLVCLWIEDNTLYLGANPAANAPEMPENADNLSVDNFIKSCRSYTSYP